ncbi:MAG: 2-oxoacid:acceptor oxidoreductase family protein, partial [Anaerolineae bacterium]|nr:2-oxoacid:acceptor oxidoreductase family protein [Anaerolineae bacterium]
LSQVTAAYHLVPGSKTAEELGNARTSNIVLLGALSTFLDVPVATWEKIIEKRVPQKFMEMNLKAFAAGRSLLGT